MKYLYNFSGPDGRVQVKKHGGVSKEGKEGSKMYFWIIFTHHTETFYLDQMVEGLIWKKPQRTLCNHIHFTLNKEKTLINVLKTAFIICSRDSKTCNEITCSIINFTGLLILKIYLENFPGPDGGIRVEKKQGGGWKVGKEGKKIFQSISLTILKHFFWIRWLRV